MATVRDMQFLRRHQHYLIPSSEVTVSISTLWGFHIVAIKEGIQREVSLGEGC